MGEEGEILNVVVDKQGRHSIWPVDRPLPSGWSVTSFTGSRAACLSHIETVWRDMRPLSLQRRMGQPARSAGPGATTACG